jgi:hypothetical protein
MHVVANVKHISCSVPFSENHAVYKDNVKKNCGTDIQATDDSIRKDMRFAYWISKVTYTHSEYVILIAFKLQHWLRERASILF